MIYHITTQKRWRLALDEGVYSPENLTSDGFIHCSTEKQVLEVANRLFHQETDLLLLMIDERLTVPEVVYENLEGGEEKYPHIYGELNLEAVVKTASMHKDRQGNFVFPTFSLN